MQKLARTQNASSRIKRGLVKFFNFIFRCAKKTAQVISAPVKRLHRWVARLLSKVGGEKVAAKYHAVKRSVSEFIKEKGESIIRTCKRFATSMTIITYMILRQGVRFVAYIIHRFVNNINYFINSLDQDEFATKSVMEKIALLVKKVYRHIRDLCCHMWEQNPVMCVLSIILVLLSLLLIPFVIKWIKIYIAGMLIFSLIPYVVAVIKLI